jgi:CBS domain-containing protein
MSAPAEFCTPSTAVSEIARTLVKKGIGAILVCDDMRHPVGIITERDLVAKVLASDDPESFAATAAEVMTPNPRTMAPDTYMFEATTFMVRHKIRHLPVVDEGELVGIVSLQELMKFRSQKSLLLLGSIKEARFVADLAAIKGEIIKVAKSLMSEARSQIETMEILSSIHHGILRRGFELVLEEMRQRGMSPPDVKYCFIVMGSGGRKEMLLDPDQDNGLIFDNYPEDKAAAVEAFFVPFLERLIQAYAETGYPLCNGGVMASNPFWRGRLKDWEAKVSNWVNAPEPQRVRYSTIFFDFMPLMGDPSLGQKLRRIVDREISRFPLFLHFMMNLDYKHKVPLNLLGRFSLEREKEHRGTLSLKQTGSIFIVDCIRMFMLEKQIYAPTTIERLDLLVKMKAFNSETAEHIKAAFEAFTFLRLRNEIALIEQGRSPSHYLDPYALTNAEQELLREAFRAASKLQDSTKRHFNVG